MYIVKFLTLVMTLMMKQFLYDMHAANNTY